MKKIAIIGGGASGLVAAIAAARTNPQAQILIYEKKDSAGKKILATGNGRCNLTNKDMNASYFHSDNLSVVEEVLQKFGYEDTIAFFTSLGLLAEEFSERVAGIVAQESEDKSKTWMERKSATIEHIRTAPKEVQMVGLADKLSNMRDIDRDYPVYGEELWNRFRMKDKGIIGWYYIGIRDALKESFEGVEAYEEYTRLVNKIFEQE